MVICEEEEIEIKTILKAHQLTILARNSEASLSLSDKNRLLANVNTNIQQKFTKLEDVNNKINTITQDIYTNNMEMKRKENIIQTLNVIIIIVVIMAIILIIYFGMGIVEEKYPNAIKNIANNFNRNNQNIFF
jgi:ABC-type Na+ efflux pump permease subunit